MQEVALEEGILMGLEVVGVWRLQQVEGVAEPLR